MLQCYFLAGSWSFCDCSRTGAVPRTKPAAKAPRSWSLLDLTFGW